MQCNAISFKKLFFRVAIMIAFSFLFILPNNIGYGQPWTSPNATFNCNISNPGIYTAPDNYVGIGPFGSFAGGTYSPQTKLHLFLPWTTYASPPLCLTTDVRNSILLETGISQQCGTSKAELGIWRSPVGPGNPAYTSIAVDGDAILRTYGDCSRNLILYTQNENYGNIRFGSRRLDPNTSILTDYERMTILGSGEVGISNPNPPNLFQVGNTFGIGNYANQDFFQDIRFNCYNYQTGNAFWHTPIQSGHSSIIQNRNDGSLLIAVSGYNAIGSNPQIEFIDNQGVPNGIIIKNTGNGNYGICSIGLGSQPNISSRVTIKGWTDNSSCAALDVINLYSTHILFARNDGNIGIGTATPDNSAILDISSTSKGFLMPRVANTSTVTSPTEGLLVYQNSGTHGFYYYDGTYWQNIGTGYGWSITGNTGTTTANNFLGTNDNVDLLIKTHGTEKLRVCTDGKIGIGTTSPKASAILDITSDNKGFLMPRIGNPSTISTPEEGLLVYQNSGTHGFYYYTGTGWQNLSGSTNSGGGWSLTGNAGTNPASNYIGTSDGVDFVIRTTGQERLRILGGTNAGNVGIGVTNPSSKLAVDGLICAKEVRVSTQTGTGAPCWPDNVFLDNYKLIGLDSLEKQIKIEKHLPNIQSASEVANDGIELGDMQIKLLQKIEELTLYVIQLKKEINTLKGGK